MYVLWQSNASGFPEVGFLGRIPPPPFKKWAANTTFESYDAKSPHVYCNVYLNKF